MGLTKDGIVSIFELIVYIPLLIASFVVTSKHGRTRAAGFVLVTVLCILRIVGSICQLLSIHDPTSTGLIETYLICQFIGLSPILFATLGLVTRASSWIKSDNIALNTKVFRIIHLVVLIAAILCIAGLSSDSDINHASTTVKVGMILYLLGFIAEVLVTLVALANVASVPHTERRIFFAVMLAFPLIAVRILYSMLSDFTSEHLFATVGGSTAIRVAMSVIEEMLVAFIYIVLGFFLPVIEQGQNNKSSTQGYVQSGDQGYDQRSNQGYDQRSNFGYDQRSNQGYDQRGNQGYDQRGNQGYGQRDYQSYEFTSPRRGDERGYK